MKLECYTKIAMRLVVGVVLINLGACAAVISGNDSTTTVKSDPTAATCLISGRKYSATLKAPKTLEIPNNAAPLTISCEKFGYFKTENIISTEGNPWVLGNALIGGGIGLIVDIASGSSVKFPSRIIVKMDSAVFSTVEAREAYYTERLAAEEKYWRRAFTEFFNTRECGPTAVSNGDCAPEDSEHLIERRNKSFQRVKLMSEQAIVSDKKLEDLDNVPKDVIFPN